jgi:hypothetical protein
LFVRSSFLAALLLLAAFAIPGPRQAAAEGVTPPLHLQAAAVSETAARFSWKAGAGNDWFCIDLASSAEDLESLSGTWFNSGCGMTGTSHLVKGLQCSAIYYARVYASTADGGVYTPQLRIDMNECASTITAPTNMRVLFATAFSARVAWDPGDHNNWFCVETALDQGELMTHGDSWVSRGCGTTEFELTIDDLECETYYYWRVAAWNFRVDTVGDIRVFKTDDCDGRLRRAPVESVELREDGAKYGIEVVVALPDGCVSPGLYRVSRDGNQVIVSVRNTYIEPLTTCADIESKHTWKINLGSDFAEGEWYVVLVNGNVGTWFQYTPPLDAH